MYHSYLTSRLLSLAHTLVQRSITLVQRCKHACAAFQNACSALQDTLVQRCKPACTALRIACSALLLLVQRPSPATHPRLHMHVAAPPPCHHWDPLPPRRLACATLHLLQRTVLAAPKHTTSTEKKTTWSSLHTHLGKAQLKKMGLYVCMCVRTSPLHPTSTPARPSVRRNPPGPPLSP